MSIRVAFGDLATSDLTIDAVFEGGRVHKHVRDDPLQYILKCGNQGGIRYHGSPKSPPVDFCVLYSTLLDAEWPDSLDMYSGLLKYYGDNKKPGLGLDATKRGGNKIFQDAFAALHGGKRDQVPPFFVFTKGPIGRDVIFRGLAIPGAANLSETEDLVAIWKSTAGNRFQNYQAIFTILDIPLIKRAWLDDLNKGHTFTKNTPKEWARWVRTGRSKPLVAPPAVNYRTKLEQLPKTPLEHKILFAVYNYFKAHKEGEYAFERCAVEIVRLMDKNIGDCDVTRPWRDGGRDALGKYRIGTPDTSIEIDFALEAKCYKATSGLGVKATQRLISRLKYRDLGLFVTTSFVSTQAYQEIIDDGHPVVILSGGDIAKLLIDHGYKTPKKVDAWLRKNFP